MSGDVGPLLSLAEQGWAHIHTGYACNNRCIFCSQGDRRASNSGPADAEVRRHLDRAAQQKNTRVAFLGGEPTLREELPDWIGYARDLGFIHVALQTNARRLAYRSYAASLARAGLDALDISLHGPRPEIHDHHTRVAGSFGHTLAGLAAAQKFGLEVGITSVVTRSNFRHLEELARRVQGLGAPWLHLALARACGEAGRLLPRVVPRWSLAGPRLMAACATATAAGVKITITGMPRCLLDTPEINLLPGGPAGPTASSSAARTTQRGQPWYAEACARCALYLSSAGPPLRCPGVDPAYVAHYGEEELASYG